MAEGESEADDVSFLRTVRIRRAALNSVFATDKVRFKLQEDMVCLSCTGTGERVCLSAEGFGNRQCFLEGITDRVIFRFYTLTLGSNMKMDMYGVVVNSQSRPSRLFIARMFNRVNGIIRATTPVAEADAPGPESRTCLIDCRTSRRTCRSACSSSSRRCQSGRCRSSWPPGRRRAAASALATRPCSTETPSFCATPTATW